MADFRGTLLGLSALAVLFLASEANSQTILPDPAQPSPADTLQPVARPRPPRPVAAAPT